MSFSQGPPGNYQSWNSEPWVWVAIPAGIVIAIGALAICIHTRRRRRRLRAGVLANPAGAQALERDLWEMWGRNAGTMAGDAELGGVHPSMAAVPGGRWTRPRTRWAWVGGGGAAGGGAGNQNEEGLNELGEAPPPYDPRALGAQGVNKPEENGVGGGVLPHGEGTGGVEPPPPVLLPPVPVGGAEGGADLLQRREVQPPPDYVEAREGDHGRLSTGNREGSVANAAEHSSSPDHVHDIARPEPAVLHNATPAAASVSTSKPEPPSDEPPT